MTILPAQADEIRPGYLEWTETTSGEWQVLWKAPLNSRIVSAGAPVIPERCRQENEPRQEFTAAARLTTYTLQCGDLQGMVLGMAGLDADDANILLRVQPLDGALQTLQLTAAQPVVTLLEAAHAENVAWTYFVLGMEHILAGFDHLLFVIALALLLHAGRNGALWPIAKAVTAFTVAHSLTLAGTTLGFVSLPIWPVEVVIALSIIFLAVEVVKSRNEAPRLSQRLPWIVAFLFGLLHGFGFAGALAEIGLPEGDVPMALLTFNLGVEAGQLLIVAAASALLWLIFRRDKSSYKAIRITAAYAIGITACFWFIERLIS
ncbi:HupE/UreJ family protein [Sphingorhabdus sp. Alg239-R122]|uniref:HupE/UreJ family protein n=1 Tax=Sphingorhabdus sp. Alg239-R122 TaxID=2305989 RepID=UPI0013DB454A|nr:HupE/UreJ family protein [Sphingorhabdus sp. Alg239-R122]